MTSRMSMQSRAQMENGDHTDADSISGMATEITTVRHNVSVIGHVMHK